MEFKKNTKQSPEISLIPLINVIFLLLIFFMVAGTVEGIDVFDVDLPKATGGKAKKSTSAVIYIGHKGRVAVNSDLVLEKDMETIISTLFMDNPEQKISIKSDSSVAAHKLIHILNIIEAAGGMDVSLVIQVLKK